MRFSLLRTLGYCVGGLWTARGGRKRIEARENAVSEAVSQQVIQSVKRVFEQNNIPDVGVRESQRSPQLTASGKFHEVLPLIGG